MIYCLWQLETFKLWTVELICKILFVKSFFSNYEEAKNKHLSKFTLSLKTVELIKKNIKFRRLRLYHYEFDPV
jgi:hypothetical protein